MKTNFPFRPIASVVGNAGLISDGDWIESKDQDQNGDVRLIQLADVGDGRYINKSSRFLTKETASRLKCTLLKIGDILVARMPDPIGRACLFPGDSKEAVTVVDVCILRVDEKITDATWLMSAINASFSRKEIEKAAGGTTRTRISRGSLEKLLLPTPSLPEQQKIAAILTVVDEKLDVIARQIETAQALKRGLMQTLFSRGVGTQDADGRWVPHVEFKSSELGEIPAGWAEKKARDLCDVRDGTHDSPKFHQDGVPLYTSKNISNGKLTSDGVKFISYSDAEKINKRSKVNRGDIIISMIGTVGEAALVDVEPNFCIKNVGLFKPDRSLVCSRYLLYFFHSPGFKAFVKTKLDGGIQKFLSLTALRELLIPLPPVSEQGEIADVMDAMREKIEALSVQRTQYQTLKRGLMQKLLTGEWRVKLEDAEPVSA